jgi:hypothetical protein
MVARLCRRHDVDTVNQKLDRMGHSIGIRIVDEYLAKTGSVPAPDFAGRMQNIAKVAFRMFLNVNASVQDLNPELTSCKFVLESNPLVRFAVLPDGLSALRVSQLLCGVIRGALEVLGMRVEASVYYDPTAPEQNLPVPTAVAAAGAASGAAGAAAAAATPPLGPGAFRHPDTATVLSVTLVEVVQARFMSDE